MNASTYALSLTPYLVLGPFSRTFLQASEPWKLMFGIEI
jgi:hypothetical protein